MDIATIVGVLGGFGVLFGAILLEGSSPSQFMNTLATLVVVGGAATAVLIRYPLHAFIGALTLGVKEAFYRRKKAMALIDELSELAEVARKEGPLGLERAQPSDPFLGRGIQMSPTASRPRRSSIRWSASATSNMAGFRKVTRSSRRWAKRRPALAWSAR